MKNLSPNYFSISRMEQCIQGNLFDREGHTHLQCCSLEVPQPLEVKTETTTSLSSSSHVTDFILEEQTMVRPLDTVEASCTRRQRNDDSVVSVQPVPPDRFLERVERTCETVDTLSAHTNSTPKVIYI